MGPFRVKGKSGTSPLLAFEAWSLRVKHKHSKA
jgi:hypothetical protein